MMKLDTSTSDSTTQSTTISTTDTTSPGSHSVILITGGISRENRNATEHSVEIFLPNNPATPCILPDLPINYAGHTQESGLLCGGYYNGTKKNCRQWNSTEGKFPITPVHEFEPSRVLHVSWTPIYEEENFLLGGYSGHL